MARTGAAVSFRGISKRFGAAYALRDFSLDIAAGEFVTLLGPSGSGKTTALNILAGFIDADGGELRIDGKDVMRLPPEQRNLGMVFQNFSLFPHLSVFDNVAFPLRLRRVAKGDVERRVMSALEMVHLADFAGRMPRTLSGGQQQRVALARSVVFEPPVMLMDESLSALDLKLREALQLEIKRLHAKVGCTILFVTHDQAEALTMSDRVAVMRDGTIVQIDTPSTIYDRPEHRFVAEFIGHTNILELLPTADGTATISEMMGAMRMPASPFISIRPEKLRRCDEVHGGTDVIRLEAVVDQPLFRGDSVHYSLRLPSGRPLEFSERRGAASEALRSGDRASLCFNISDVVPVRVDEMRHNQTKGENT